MNDPVLNHILLNLAEACISIYPADSTGAPILSQQLWTGAKAEGLRVMERWIVMETKPSGAPYPNKHPLVAQYEIAIDKVWSLALSELNGFQAEWTNYVVDIVWTDEDTGNWQRRVFYGGTIADESLNSRSIDAGFTEGQNFNAQYYDISSGTAASPPGQISSALPYQVMYQPAAGAAPILIYTYNPTTEEFTAVGNPSSYATIGYNGSGAFGLTFAGDGSPVLATTVAPSGAATYRNSEQYSNINSYQPAQFQIYGSINVGAPAPTNYPRIVFYYGNTPVCTLTSIAGGTPGMFEANWDEGTPAVLAGDFAVYAGANVIASLGSSGVTSKNFVVINGS